MRNLASGQILEDIDMYHKVHEMFSVLHDTSNRENYFGGAFSHYLEGKVDSDTLDVRYLRASRAVSL